MQHADFINTLNTLFDETWYRDEIMTAVEEQRKKDATGIESIQDSEVSIQSKEKCRFFTKSALFNFFFAKYLHI